MNKCRFLVSCGAAVIAAVFLMCTAKSYAAPQTNYNVTEKNTIVKKRHDVDTIIELKSHKITHAQRKAAAEHAAAARVAADPEAAKLAAQARVETGKTAVARVKALQAEKTRDGSTPYTRKFDAASREADIQKKEVRKAELREAKARRAAIRAAAGQTQNDGGANE